MRTWEEHGLGRAPSEYKRWWEPKSDGMVAMDRFGRECGEDGQGSDQLSVISNQSSGGRGGGEVEEGFVRGGDRWITSKEAAAILGVRPLRVNRMALQGRLRRRLEGAGGSLQEAGGRGKRAWFLLSGVLRLADERASVEWRRGISPRDWNYDLMHPVIRTRIEAPEGDRLISPLEAAGTLDVGRRRISELVMRARLFGRQTEPGKRGVRLWLSENQAVRYRDNPARIMAREKLLDGRKEKEEFDEWREWLGLVSNRNRKRPTIDREHGEYFNTQQAARALGVHIKTVGKLRMRGRLRGHQRVVKRKGGGYRWWFYRKDDVYDLLADGKYARNRSRAKAAAPKLWEWIVDS